MPALEIDLDPQFGVDVEVLEDLAFDPKSIRAFSPRRSMSSALGVITLRVNAATGETFVCRFEGGYPSPKSLTVVTNGPRPDQLVVVNRGAGFILSATDPDVAIDLDISPVIALVVDPVAGVVLAADFTNVTAVGPEGRLWSAEVSWDGVEFDDVEAGILRGRGWDAPTGTHVPFEVDVSSGAVLKGPTPRP